MPQPGDKRKLLLSQDQISDLVLEAVKHKGLVPDGYCHISVEYSLIPISNTDEKQVVELQATLLLTYKEEPN